ncbi:hypothetical protein BKI49_19840 [Streptomyces sp. Tue6028]|uniref:type II secretion system F family protein n=1 Tax=Streptomyces sp. Tue6028 TaxID=2036037 RepID=UPI000BB3A46F|nr:type II secretion system F family protein [Streptomyces sp. Tue6028]PBC62482.1 hypothetical protein BKI49_19840 [Streptomyces sp. Tue6028]
MIADVVHRLGAMMCGALALGWSAHALHAARHERRVRRRLIALANSRAAPVRRRLVRPRGGRRWVPVVGAVCAGWVLIGGLAGAAIGLAAGCAARQWLRRRRAEPVEEYDRAHAARQLPLAADLVAACIAAGAGPVVAARAVGEALGGPVGDRLARGAAEVRLGGEPAQAWAKLASMPGAPGLARLLERAGDSGVPAAAPVGRLAAEARAERGRAATARARRAAVMVTAPVGLCFLPAFLAIGVLPVVIGLAGGLLHGGGG